jgi:hypothetical protein
MPSITLRRRQLVDSIDNQRATGGHGVGLKTGDKLEPTSEGSSEVTEAQLNQVARPSMTSVSRVLETCGCGVQLRTWYMNLISIIPGLRSPDIP